MRDFEIVVVDDCSQEDIETRVSAIRDSRIRYHRNSQNIGMVANFNRCVRLARGKFVSILHTDDSFESAILERESQFLETHPDVGMVYTAHYLAHELSGRRKTISPYPQDQILAGTALLEALFRNGNHISFSCVMVRKRCYEEVGDFQTSLPYSSDLEMWLRLSLHFPVGYLADPLVTWRFHSEMESFKFFRSSEAVDQEWQAIRMAIEQTPWPRDQRDHWLRRARWYLGTITMSRALFHADKGMVTVRKHLSKAALISPRIRLHPLYWLIHGFTLMGDRTFLLLNRFRVRALNGAVRYLAETRRVIRYRHGK